MRSGRGEWYMRWLPLAIALPYLANTTGWLMTEWGRQPWIVFGLMQTSEAVSPNVPGGAVLASLLGFTLVYGVLMAADIYLLAKNARGDDGTPEPHPSPKRVAFRAGGAR